jgi:excisionase family DNA binding protein
VPAPEIVEKLLTYKQAGALLGITERTVWTLVAAGELPAVRFGRSVRIDPADLRGFIDRSKAHAKGARENTDECTKQIGGEQ